jgi:hypothetical protein
MKLKDPEPFHRVIVATWRSMQGPSSESLASEKRVKQLKQETGLKIEQFTDCNSAWTIVDAILDKGTIQVDTIHAELAKICKQLHREVPTNGRKHFNFLARLLGF